MREYILPFGTDKSGENFFFIAMPKCYHISRQNYGSFV